MSLEWWEMGLRILGIKKTAKILEAWNLQRDSSVDDRRYGEIHISVINHQNLKILKKDANNDRVVLSVAKNELPDRNVTARQQSQIRNGWRTRPNATLKCLRQLWEKKRIFWSRKWCNVDYVNFGRTRLQRRFVTNIVDKTRPILTVLAACVY